MLVIYEALYFGDDLKDSLLDPNQLRAAGVIVNDAPQQFDATSSHSISVSGTLEIPLKMHGVISYFDTRLPTMVEIEQYRQDTFNRLNSRRTIRGNHIQLSLPNVKLLFNPRLRLQDLVRQRSR